jgi:hypothetical protein
MFRQLEFGSLYSFALLSKHAINKEHEADLRGLC